MDVGVWTLDSILGIAIVGKALITDHTLNLNETDD